MIFCNCIGRTWLTTYRGPLWIHASAKSPRKEEIEEACSLFRLMIDDKKIKFPNKFPLGMLYRFKVILKIKFYF